MYWSTESEIALLTCVLETFDPDEDRRGADNIICGLIEMGLVDDIKAPNAQQAWCDNWEGCDVPYEFVRKHYVDDLDGTEDDR